MGTLGIREKKWIVLQKRDLALLEFLSEQKFATRDQIARRFFPNERGNPTRPDRVAYRRLLTLRRFGMVEARHVRTDPEQIYQVARLGLSRLAAASYDCLPYLAGIDLATFVHDRWVTDVRIAIEKLATTKWQSERRLSGLRWLGHRPDAVFSIGRNQVALEMELSRKRDDRYMAILRSYSDHREIDAILYLCGTDRIRETVLRFAARSGTPRRYYTALWADWQRNEDQTEFLSRFDRLFLKELVS